jgi:hypothetical protein
MLKQLLASALGYGMTRMEVKAAGQTQTLPKADAKRLIRELRYHGVRHAFRYLP